MTETHQSRPNVGDVEDQFRLIREDVTTLAKLLREIGENKTVEAREAALAEASALLERSEAALRETSAGARNTLHSVEDHIREKPVQAAAIALGVGLLIGFLSRR